MSMLGLLINEKEQQEIEYLLKRELEELLLDMEDERMDVNFRKKMQKRYKRLFHLLKRIASDQVCLEYMISFNEIYNDPRDGKDR